MEALNQSVHGTANSSVFSMEMHGHFSFSMKRYLDLMFVFLLCTSTSNQTFAILEDVLLIKPLKIEDTFILQMTF